MKKILFVLCIVLFAGCSMTEPHPLEGKWGTRIERTATDVTDYLYTFKADGAFTYEYWTYINDVQTEYYEVAGTWSTKDNILYSEDADGYVCNGEYEIVGDTLRWYDPNYSVWGEYTRK